MGGPSGPVDVNNVTASADTAETETTEATETEAAEVEADAEVEATEEEAGRDEVETVDVGDDDGAATVPGPVVQAAWLGQTWVLLALYAAVAAVITWPLVAHLTGSMAYGNEPVATVPLFNLWTLEWNQLQIGDLYGDYWNAPLFHPTDGAFALSEPQPVTGLVFAPIAWLTGNPVLGYNLVALAILTLNGYTASRLARTLGAAPGPAALAGVPAVSLSFVMHQMGVLQLTAVFPLLLLIEALLRWVPNGGRRPAAMVGLWLAVTFLTCGYYGLFAVVSILPVTLVLFRRAWLSRERLIDVAVGAAVFAVLALPVLVTQASITSEYERTEDVIRGLSAGGEDFWQLVDGAHGSDLMPWLHPLSSGHGLYPGTVLLLLGAGGLLLGSRDPGAARSRGATLLDERRRPLFLFAGVCLAWLLSRGLKLSAFGFQPYDVVRTTVPGFDELRSPFRFAVLAEVFLVGLTAYGLDALWHLRWRRLPAGRWRMLTGPVLACALVVFAVWEVSIMPVRLFDVERSSPEWVDWLEEQDQESWAANEGPDDRPVLAFLPVPTDGRVASFEDTVRHLRETTDAGATMVNGYSGLFPDEYHDLVAAMGNYPSSEADAIMRDYGVDYLVVDVDWLDLDPDRASWLAYNHQVFSSRDTLVYELQG